LEDESGDDQTKKNFNNTISDVIDSGIGRVALEKAGKE
jgi:hypothetical protein